MITDDLHVRCDKCGAVSSDVAAGSDENSIDELRMLAGQKERFSFCIVNSSLRDFCADCRGSHNGVR